MTTRRAFLGTSLAVVPAFVARAAAAAPDAASPGARDTILVVVEMTGGNDGLNTVVPHRDPMYCKLRPTLALDPKSLHKVNDDLGLHPSMKPFAELLDAGHLAIVQGVGYPNPSQSHFRSMDVWQAGSLAESLTEGWLGRALKAMPKGSQSFHLRQDNQPAPLAYEGAPMRTPSVATLEEFRLQLLGPAGDRRAQEAIIEHAVKPRTAAKPGLLDFVARTGSATYAAGKRLAEVGKTYEPKVPYPATALGGRLRLAAQLIEAGVGARLFYVSIDGFDTHASQAPSHASLLTQVSAAMSAFFRDMKARGHGNRVLMMTFSEFGRRAKENGSKGTDHGSASQVFLVGGKVKPGVVGAHPSLTDTPLGNLTHHTDFRAVYANVLTKWLGVDAKEVLGAAYEGVKVV